MCLCVSINCEKFVCGYEEVELEAEAKVAAETDTLFY